MSPSIDGETEVRDKGLRTLGAAGVHRPRKEPLTEIIGRMGAKDQEGEGHDRPICCPW